MGLKLKNELFMIFWTLSMPHASYKGLRSMWLRQTPYDLIVTVILCRVYHISNDNLCGTEQTLCELIWNAVQLESFSCYSMYNTTCYYVCNRHSKNQWFEIQCTIQYLVSWKMSYPVKLCHFWEHVRIKFEQLIVVRMGISNPYVHLNL